LVTLLYLWLGGALAAAIGTLSADRVRQASLPAALAAIFVGAAMWPVSIVFPLVQWLAVRRGWWGMSRVHCPVCEKFGTAKDFHEGPLMMIPPSGWVIFVVNRPGGAVVDVTCSEPCARVLREHWLHHEAS
jgi:hypothetical protein